MNSNNLYWAIYSEPVYTSVGGIEQYFSARFPEARSEHRQIIMMAMNKVEEENDFGIHKVYTSSMNY